MKIPREYRRDIHTRTSRVLEKLYVKHGGRCPICGEPFTSPRDFYMHFRNVHVEVFYSIERVIEKEMRKRLFGNSHFR